MCCRNNVNHGININKDAIEHYKLWKEVNILLYNGNKTPGHGLTVGHLYMLIARHLWQHYHTAGTTFICSIHIIMLSHCRKPNGSHIIKCCNGSSFNKIDSLTWTVVSSIAILLPFQSFQHFTQNDQ
jgi:hypothetical protein